MAHYDLEDLTEIIERTADIFEVDITGDGAFEMARSGSSGYRALLNQVSAKRVRDYAQIKGNRRC